jgi:hypothetical protein
MKIKSENSIFVSTYDWGIRIKTQRQMDFYAQVMEDRSGAIISNLVSDTVNCLRDLRYELIDLTARKMNVNVCS